MTCTITIDCCDNTRVRSRNRTRTNRAGFYDSLNCLSVYLTEKQREWVEKEARTRRHRTGRFVAMSTVVSDLVEAARLASLGMAPASQPQQDDLFDDLFDVVEAA